VAVFIAEFVQERDSVKWVQRSAADRASSKSRRTAIRAGQWWLSATRRRCR